MIWKSILLKDNLGRVRRFVEHIKTFFVQNPQGLIKRYTRELEQVEKQLEQISDYVEENGLGQIRERSYGFSPDITIYQSEEDFNNRYDRDYDSKRNKKLENQVEKLYQMRNSLERKLERYASIDNKLEIFNDPIKLTEYANERYRIDLTEPKMLELFMETMRVEGMEAIEGAVKLAGSVQEKTDEREINFSMLQQTVNMLVHMNNEIPTKQDVAEEMEIDMNQQWDYRADKAYDEAIQLLRQRGKL
tara:strand:- start:124 stop:864 length:741 start_codon:yes stop_codon:yes gene_type:complete